MAAVILCVEVTKKDVETRTSRMQEYGMRLYQIIHNNNQSK